MSTRDEESTQEIDVDALRDSLAAARSKSPAKNKNGPQSDRETTRVSRDEAGIAQELEPLDPLDPLDPLEPLEPLEPLGPLDDDDLSVDLADVNDISDDDEDSIHGRATSTSTQAVLDVAPATRNDLDRRPDDPAPSLIGTLPGYEVAQALRAMMGEVPDTYARDYREPETGISNPHAHDNATPFIEPRGYRPLNYDNDAAVRDDNPSGITKGGVVVTNGSGDHDDGGDNAAPIDESLEDGDTQTRLPGDPPSLSVKIARFSSESPSDDDDDALPAFALEDDDDDDDVDAAQAPQEPPPPASPPERWGMDTLTSGAPSAMNPNSARLGNAPATTRVLAPPIEEQDVHTDATMNATLGGGIPTPAFAMEAAQIAENMQASEPRLAAAVAETTANFKGPLPSMALPSLRDEVLNTERERESNQNENDDDDHERDPLRDSFIEDSEPAVRKVHRHRNPDWDPSEPSSHFPVAKPRQPPPPSPQSSPSFAAVESGELEAFPNPEDLPGDRTAIAQAHRGDGIGGHLSDSIDDALGALGAENNNELPRFTLASIPEMSTDGPAPEAAPADDDDLVVAAAADDRLDDEENVEEPTATGTPIIEDQPPPSERTFAPITPAVPISEGLVDSDGDGAIDVRISSPDPTEAGVAAPLAADGGHPITVHEETTSAGRAPPEVLAHARGAEEQLDEAEIVDIEPDELIEDDLSATNIGAPHPNTFASSGQTAATRSPSFRPPPGAAAAAAAAFVGPDAPDAEEEELIAEQRWGPLIAVYRQKLADTDGPNKKAAILIKIAGVYENGMLDKNEAFGAVVDAFETAPGNEDVISEVDRLGKETQRIGELADRTKKKLLPGAPDDKRIHYLGHLVYWYERVLNRGREVSSLVSEIERHDKVHPVVLKRAAQIAAMNGDTKTQREHLQRALERTFRREEKVALHLTLAGAYAGTPDAMKHYETALTLDPTSLVAIQGLKRLGKEKEQYAQIQWALERQAEVAPTESEKVDALLELAELQETKFLKREAAAELYEQVLTLEPSQPSALKALERCYHAIRDWPRLSRILAVRAEHTFEKSQKVELFERAAEVHESKLGDPAGAVEVYRNLLVVEPKHRRALADLARLYEKLGDWGNVATYKARLAELAPSKRASSQELVKLGDFLNHPERDPIAAKLQYEKAVQVDATNALAWEQLQKFAVAEGDERRVIECLEQRKKHTDVPRQRAVVLVELANVHQRMGDDEAAKKCFEAAIRADSSNEIAAVAMLDVYTAEERWGEAAPLCELLVNAAIRDRDGEGLFVRLRLATRIAAALGDADRAVTSAVAALDARPKDAGAQADLIAVCSQSMSSVPRVREPILRVAESCEELSAELLVRLATLVRELNELDVAAATLESARKLDPDSNDIIKELADVYLAQADFPRACKLKVDMARNATEPDLRFDLLVDAAEIWAKRADELEKAASLFEEARGIKPNDPWLLQTLIWLYGELGEWGLLIGVTDDLAQTQDNPADRIKSFMSMAEIVRDKMNDRVRAADLFDQAIDLDKNRLDIFEEVVRVLTEEKNWERLERAYRKMIARVKDDDEPQLQFLLFHQLGLIYRDRLGDASRAYDALDAASRLQPENAEVRKIVTELLVVTDNLDNAVQRIRDEIDRDPHDPQLYAELYELFLRQHSFDKAWCAVNVLARLRDLSVEQLRFHDDYSPMQLDRIPGQIVEQAWRSHIFHPDLDVALTNLFAVMTPAVARMRFGQLRPEQRVGRPFTPTHSRMHDAIRITFNNASEILAVAPPELLLGDLKSATPFAPALAPFGAILVSGPAVEAQADSLIYMCGKRLAEQRPELTARAFLTVPDLVSLLATAIRVSRQEVARDPAAQALDQSFSAILTPQERESIRRIVTTATQDGNSFDVKRWSQCADLSSMRAGLLLAGDVEPARNSIGAEIVAPADLTPREKVGELLKFATSDQYSDLRGAIGVAVQG